VKKVILMVAGMVVVRLSPILGNTQNSTPCQIRREWKWMRRRESWRVLSKISPHRSPDAPIPPIRLCPNLCVSRTILGLGHPCRRKWSKYRRPAEEEEEEVGRTEEAGIYVPVRWRRGFLVDRLLWFGLPPRTYVVYVVTSTNNKLCRGWTLRETTS